LTLAVIADDGMSNLELIVTCFGSEYSSLTPQCSQAHYFERELFEQWGIRPNGHPWLKPVRFPAGDDRPQVGDVDYFEIDSEETHTVAVGPVHAGIIEPGHFQFSCHGEQVLHLEVALGYQHRGIEKALLGGPDRRTISYLETAAGDTTVGHMLAYCQVVESLAGIQCTPRDLYIRAMALELERLANHVGDLGGISGDVAYLPTASYCGGLRGDYLNLTATLCGNRLGRGLIRPGGLGFVIDGGILQGLRQRLPALYQATTAAVDLLWSSASVRARLEFVARLEKSDVIHLGMVGPAARASGVAIDVRHDHPLGIWHNHSCEIVQGGRGDVYARARQRWLEIVQSHRDLETWLDSLAADPVVETKAVHSQLPALGLAPEQLVVSLVEGWRGEICHLALTDAAGHFSRYKLVDPSFHNWYGLALAMRGQPILDFPVCNKSFDLSYCGHDL